MHELRQLPSPVPDTSGTVFIICNKSGHLSLDFFQVIGFLD